MSGKMRIQTTINREPQEFLCEPRQSLLECLRDTLGLTGTKEGCNDGNCGACTVIMDDRIVTSCLVLGVEAEGCRITTIEGIAKGDYQAAAVAADMLERAEAAGVITKDKYRSIYKSESFPSACVMYALVCSSGTCDASAEYARPSLIPP